jgi:hypothetical protein
MKSISIIAIAAILTGCMSAPKSFPEPSFPKVSYEQVKRVQDPPRLKLSAEFKRDDKVMDKVTKDLYAYSERVLRGSGAIIPSTNGEDGTFHIQVQNLVDHGTAIVKGMGTGLTLGLVGNTVTDRYVIKITIIRNGKKIERADIKHYLHSTMGLASIPEGVEAMSIPRAFDKMIEEVILSTLDDMQKTGELSVQQAPSLWSRMATAMS